MAKVVLEDTTLTAIGDSIRSKTGKTDLLLPSEMPSEIESITGGGSSNDHLESTSFTGSYDVEGLKEIGWTEEDIEFYNKYGVQWNAEQNEVFKLTEEELQGDNTSSTRFVPKGSTLKNFQSYHSLLAIPSMLEDNNIIYNLFNGCHSLTAINQLNANNQNNMNNAFQYCYSLQAIGAIFNTTQAIYMNNTFSNCYSLKTIPLFDTSNVIGMSGVFKECYSLKTIPLFDTNNVTNPSEMFYGCHSLETVPLFNTEKARDIHSMFSNCYSLKTIPLLDFSNATNALSLFSNCYSLKTIPSLDLSNITSAANLFNNCYSLGTLPLLDFSNVTNVYNTFQNCRSLKHVDGFRNLGKSYDATSANASTYTLNLSFSNNLTKESLINIINNLYDLKSKSGTFYTQTLTLGSTNKAKLTPEIIAIATEKGWTVN